MQQREDALAQGRNFRAFEVDFAIERHQQLHSFQLAVVSGELTTLVDKFVGEVFDGVAQYFKCVTRLRIDTPAAYQACADNFSCWRGDCYRETGRRCGCHDVHPHLSLRPFWHSF